MDMTREGVAHRWQASSAILRCGFFQEIYYLQAPVGVSPTVQNRVFTTPDIFPIAELLLATTRIAKQLLEPGDA